MKLSQGEYVALEKVENVYSTVSLLQTCFVYGDSLRDYVVGVVVPDPVQLIGLAERLKIVPTGTKVDPTNRKALDEIITHPQVYTEIMKGMNTEAKKAGLKGLVLSTYFHDPQLIEFTFHRFESVKRVHITNEPFTADNGLLTATFKIKRLVLPSRASVAHEHADRYHYLL